MKLYDISANIKIEPGFLDDPDTSVAELTINESKNGKWVKTGDIIGMLWRRESLISDMMDHMQKDYIPTHIKDRLIKLGFMEK